MMPQPNLMTCSECGETFFADHHIMTLDAEVICYGCADDQPKYCITDLEHRDEPFYSSATCNGEEIATGFYADPKDAENRINEMCKALWKKSPIEDD